MFSREQQTLIDMPPGADGTVAINGRVVSREATGAWLVAADTSCQNVRRCSTLPDALSAVQAEKRPSQPVVFHPATACGCGWQTQAQRDFELAASWKQIAEEYRIDLEVERSRACRTAAAELAS